MTTALPTPPPKLKRRDFLKFSILGLGAWALVKTGLSLGGDEPHTAASPKHLTPALAATFLAAATAIAGPEARKALDAGRWDPIADFDNLLDRLADDQRALALTGLRLFEHATWLRPFSKLPLEARLQQLEAWRSSSLALKRSIWGLLHAASSVSYGSKTAWGLMQYPGPSIAGPEGPGRTPGQSAPIEWDAKVP